MKRHITLKDVHRAQADFHCAPQKDEVRSAKRGGRVPRALLWVLGLAPMLLLLVVGCTGTEAGNPYTPLTISSCKGQEDYRGINASSAPFELWRGDALAPSRVPSPVPYALGDLSRIPIWLECLEWDTQGPTFRLQLANFRGGCAVDWAGAASVVQDAAGKEEIVVDLKNESCEVARCGNCIYDLRLDQALDLREAPQGITVRLVRRDCEGEIELESRFELPARPDEAGMWCHPADSWGAVMAADEAHGLEQALYAPCGEETGDGVLDAVRTSTCEQDLTCGAGRCVASCVEDADCPLGSAEACVEGFCELR